MAHANAALTPRARLRLAHRSRLRIVGQPQSELPVDLGPVHRMDQDGFVVQTPLVVEGSGLIRASRERASAAPSL